MAPTLRELTASYTDALLGPRVGPDVCRTCFNFTDGYPECYACAHNEDRADVVAPISYSVALGRVHRTLAAYKRVDGALAQRLTVELAAVLWRHLAAHERCLAAAAGVDRFDLVTSVPSGDRTRDEQHPLRAIVGEIVGPTRGRYERVLIRSPTPVEPRIYDARKFHARRRLDGEPVLLIDDTWTTGASAQSAAAALKEAGAGPVSAVVIGRHLNREWHQNEQRLRGITQPFDWSRCTICSDDASVVAAADQRRRPRALGPVRRSPGPCRAPPRNGL